MPLAVAYVVVLVVRDLPLARALWIALPPLVTGLLLVRAGPRQGTGDRVAAASAETAAAE